MGAGSGTESFAELREGMPRKGGLLLLGRGPGFSKCSGATVPLAHWLHAAVAVISRTAFCGVTFGLRNTLQLTAADGLDAPRQSQSSGPSLVLCRCVAALLVKAFPRKCTSHPIKAEARRAIVCARGLSGAGLGNGEQGR